MIGGRLIDEEPHLDRLERSLREIGMAMPMGRAALKLVMREMVAPQPHRATACSICRSRAARSAAITSHPADGPRPTLIMTARSQDLAGRSKQRLEKGIAVVTQPDMRWGRCDIKTVQLLPNLLAKTGGPQGRRLRGLAGGR